MPRNVQDFKDHPVYVLERHLKHNQVIHLKKEVGKVNIGTAALSNMESVYRRRDVHIVRSADTWYRFGREVMVSTMSQYLVNSINEQAGRRTTLETCKATKKNSPLSNATGHRSRRR